MTIDGPPSGEEDKSQPLAQASLDGVGQLKDYPQDARGEDRTRSSSDEKGEELKMGQRSLLDHRVCIKSLPPAFVNYL